MSEYDLNNPQSDVESYLANMDGILAPLPLPPESNVEKYLAHIVGVQGVELPHKPDSRVEAYLEKLALDPPQPVTPILVEKSITNNGVYSAGDDNADGYSKVTVEVPDPVLDDITITENGVYTSEHDGFDEVTVEVPDPVLDDITITENGVYTSEHDGFDEVTVEVPDPVLDDITITENGVYTSEHDGFDEVTVSVSPPEDSYQLKSITTPTSLATFEASAMPMPTLKASIKAKQDLHGYDKPWVGGAWKNKLPLVLTDIKSANTTGTWSGNTYTISSATFTVNTDDGGNVVSIIGKGNGSAGNALLLPFTLSAGSYILSSGFDEMNGTNDTFLQSNGVTIARGNSGSPGQSFTLIQDSSCNWLFRVTSMTNYVCTPMIRLASVSDATFAPYSNECPITGWDAVVVSDTGKNLFDASLMTSPIHMAKWVQIQLKANVTYTISSSIPYSSSSAYIFAVQGTDTSGATSGTNGVGSGHNQTITTGDDGIISIGYRSNGASGVLNLDDYTYQIEVGTSASEYVPYITPSTTTISLPQTVYGGEVDVVNGVMKDVFENGIINIGEQTFVYNSTSKTFYLRLLNSKEYTSTEVANAVSSAFKCVANNAMSDLTLDNCFSIHKEAGSVWLNIRCLAYSDANSFVNAMGGQTLMYEVTSPTTIQLTPTLIKSLNGLNNLSVDSGEVIEGEYFKAL